MQILVVEDETKVANALKQGFAAEGIEATVATTGEEGFFLATTRHFDLIVLDCNLPGRDGIEILATLRSRGDDIAVLVLTARDSIDDRVAGLDAGADDYLVKPFSFAELLARVRALLRRGRTQQVLRLRVADLEMDLVTRKVTRDQQTLTLTQREYDLLEQLLRSAGQVVTRDMLARDVWQYPENRPMRPASLDNLIDVQIARLRKKLDEPFGRRLLHTIRGSGFLLSEETPG